MDLSVHDEILWRACVLAHQRGSLVQDPRAFFPLLVRGSWMNDINQSTIATDKVPKHDAQEAVKRGIHAFWMADSAAMLERMKTDPERKDVYAAAAANLAKVPAGNIDDFGTYDRFDHLDVLQERNVDIDVPSAGRDKMAVSMTIKETRGVLINRLNAAAGLSDRFEWPRMTTFGRALHMVADFFAHTNYIEILLWQLTQLDPPTGLSETVLRTFNGRRFDAAEPWRAICPLPKPNEVDPCLAGGGGLFYYGSLPEHTPLVSTVFEMTDTICTLLGMYTKHLRRMDEWAALGEGPAKDKVDERDKLLDIAMAFVDLSASRKWIVRSGFSLYRAMDDAVRAIGRKVRKDLANMIEETGKRIGGSAADMLGAAAKVVRAYDSAEAAQWAAAGRYEAIVQMLTNDMLSGLHKAQKAGRFVLPHHTLLRKDAEPPGAEHLVRFNLACTLAVEASAQLVSWYFSNSPTEKEAENVVYTFLRHPCKQERTSQQNEALSTLVSSLNGPPWLAVPHPTTLVVMKQEN